MYSHIPKTKVVRWNDDTTWVLPALAVNLAPKIRSVPARIAGRATRRFQAKLAQRIK